MKDINYKLVIVGTGPCEKELIKYADGFNNIQFKGFQTGEDLLNYIRNARCVVLPSEWYENCPYSAMESLGKGKPLIVSNFGGLPEIVDDSIDGFVYNNIDELKKCIEKMINLTNEQYSSMCKNALEKAKLMFDPDKYIDKLLGIDLNE